LTAWFNREAFHDRSFARHPRCARLLSISCAGSDGAFGAGLLNGWSETCGRPQFKMLTVVSTGAPIAPAFLGSDFDQALKKDAYITIDASRIFVTGGLLPMLSSEAVTSTKPLQDPINPYISNHICDLIAAECKKGRRPYVASARIDADQPIMWDMWNMGAIAASGKPDRSELFRKVLPASASIPSRTTRSRFTIHGLSHGRLYDIP
jgi:hypothetical protein